MYLSTSTKVLCPIPEVLSSTQISYRGSTISLDSYCCFVHFRNTLLKAMYNQGWTHQEVPTTIIALLTLILIYESAKPAESSQSSTSSHFKCLESAKPAESSQSSTSSHFKCLESAKPAESSQSSTSSHFKYTYLESAKPAESSQSSTSSHLNALEPAKPAESSQNSTSSHFKCLESAKPAKSSTSELY